MFPVRNSFGFSFDFFSIGFRLTWFFKQMILNIFLIKKTIYLNDIYYMSTKCVNFLYKKDKLDIKGYNYRQIFHNCSKICINFLSLRDRVGFRVDFKKNFLVQFDYNPTHAGLYTRSNLCVHTHTFIQNTYTVWFKKIGHTLRVENAQYNKHFLFENLGSKIIFFFPSKRLTRNRIWNLVLNLRIMKLV